MKKHGPGGGEGAAAQASGMLTAFASVGARRFDLTFTDAAGRKVGFRPDWPLDRLRASFATILPGAEARGHNVIVRPRSLDTALVQLDDIDDTRAERLRPVSFLILRTSPGSYQAWVALPGPANPEFARRLREGTGADRTASGATRVSGSLNFKDKYAPGVKRHFLRPFSDNLVSRSSCVRWQRLRTIRLPGPAA